MRDGVLFLEAASFALLEGEEHRVPGTWMRPWLEGNLVDAVSRRVQALGADRELLGDAAPWKERFPQLLTALEGRTVIIAQDRESFLLRFKTHLPDGELPTVLTLEELGVFLHPKRGDRSFAGLWREHCSNTPPLAPRATDLRRLCEALISKHFERDLNLRKLVARGFDNIEDASSDDPGPAASWLRTCRALLNRTSEWGFAAPGEERLFGTTLEDGMFEYDLDNAPLDADRCLDAIVPAFRAEYDTFFAETDALQIRQEDEQAPLEPEDLEILERFFDRLPLEFAGEGETPPERPGQRALAHAVRGCLENHQFLLADAPTGTGKTLAYLGPLLLWAVRHQTRTGVSTYTRALQEQAFFREIPRALKLLQEAGLPFENLPRVSMLKGRNNFICGRAIRDTAPTTGSSSAVAHASWLRLALYYCEDPAADLDGFPADPGIPLGNSMSTMREARAAINSVRAIPQCCVGRALKRCPAGIRTLRADRSHVIITNHAFVLARPDYFQHLVFDECDHLHQVTTSALSFDIEFDEVYNLCKNLQHGRGRDASPMQQLVRILTRLAPGDVSDELRLAAKNASEGVSELDTASLACLRELKAYRAWRRDNGDHLSREEKAFLLHDFLQLGLGDALATALNSLKEAVDKLDSGLRTVIEELGTVPLRAAGRLRWSLRKPLDLLAHWREGLFLWLGSKNEDPAEGEKGDFSEAFLYDAEFNGTRRRPLLCLKFLMPQEWIGEKFLPSLRGAALVSATTYLRGGFKAMKGYLGIDIMEETTMDRPGRTVLEFQGPSTFDAQAGLVCIPQDAPEYGYSGPRKDDWMEYVEDILLHLGTRAGGRTLGLFTNRNVLQQVGERLAPEFASRGIPLWWQGMPGLTKEEIAERFRSRTDSVLLGLDTFWYGVDFPGETCEYVVMTKLPFGVLDDYHFAQTARMGYGRQRNRIYLPRALAMFRQGCGRLIRTAHDRGGILLLDRRVLDKRNGNFLEELPGGVDEWDRPIILTADTDTCFQKLFAHMHLSQELQRRGLTDGFHESRRNRREGRLEIE